jgi:hypothetical protein
VRLSVGPRFSQLLHNPESIRISRHTETQNLPSVMAYDKEAIQYPEGDRRYREEVHGCNRLAMVPQKRQPPLDGIGWSRDSPKPS